MRSDFKVAFRSLKRRPGYAAVIVATVRALKLHGGADKKNLAKPDPEAVKRGFANLKQHIENVKKFDVPAVVALNRFVTDAEEELVVVEEGCKEAGARVARANIWEQGGEGGLELGEAVLQLLDGKEADFKPLYDEKLPIKEKIETVAKEIYRADGVDYSPQQIAQVLETKMDKSRRGRCRENDLLTAPST